MKATALNRADTGEPQGWFCGKCGTIYGHPTMKDLAERCCMCSRCFIEHSRDRGAMCEVCKDVLDVERDARDYEKAKKVLLAEYGEPFIYLDGYGRDGFIDSDDLDELPEGIDWAWGTSERQASWSLDDNLHESLITEHHEDAEDSVDWSKVAEAQELIDVALKDVKTWDEDRSVVVLLPTRDKS